MKSYNKQIVASQLLNANYNTPAIEMYGMFGFNITAIITGTPTGSIALQSSVDEFKPQQTGYEPTNWNTIDNSRFDVSSSGTVTWNYNGEFATYVRVTYRDDSSGASTATMTIRSNAKG